MTDEERAEYMKEYGMLDIINWSIQITKYEGTKIEFIKNSFAEAVDVLAIWHYKMKARCCSIHFINDDGTLASPIQTSINKDSY